MDIKAIIESVVKKLEGDSDLKEKFLKNPMEEIKSLVEGNLPEDGIKSVIEGVTKKIGMNKVEDMASGAMDKIKGIFK